MILIAIVVPRGLIFIIINTYNYEKDYTFINGNFLPWSR
ncbi:hypothetical protein BH23BAC1_BH23BAC1_12390 [soil metagenome]